MSDDEPEKGESVQIVDADVLDEMNETDSLIVERAHEIFESRGGRQSANQEEWTPAPGEVSPELEIDFDVSETAVQLTAAVPGFAAKDLEVIIGHRRAVICGVRPDSNSANGSGEKKILRVVELPFDVDPVPARATLQSGKLQVLLPRLEADDASQLGRAAGL